MLEARVKRFILITVILLVAAAAPLLPQAQARPAGHARFRKDDAPPPSP